MLAGIPNYDGWLCCLVYCAGFAEWLAVLVMLSGCICCLSWLPGNFGYAFYAGRLATLCRLLLTMLDIISGCLYRLCLLDFYSGCLAMPNGRLDILAGFPGYSVCLCTQYCLDILAG
jgi:hypothetical protein